ncbi:gamma-glutamylcyclotransferase-like [Clavelina lepadiformis]|uniref:gamma-glutamylcyclotransferase n=1 Tax=Clavelina lepadiformis TaxID=159417 RepID=A0ABP0GL22_CLALP
MSVEKKALYFAYGSNMSSKWLLRSSPTAIAKATGEVKDKKLVYVAHKEQWQGATASLFPQVGETVSGTVWELPEKDLIALGAVETETYIKQHSTVHTKDGPMLCAYFFRRNTSESDIGLPSPQYVQVIIEGAVEQALPEAYIAKLRATANNGNKTITDTMTAAMR